jgi:hypothetical protein
MVNIISFLLFVNNKIYRCPQIFINTIKKTHAITAAADGKARCSEMFPVYNCRHGWEWRKYNANKQWRCDNGLKPLKQKKK